MNKKDLASLIALREGKKHEASIGDVREIIATLFLLMEESDEVLDFMLYEVTDIVLKRSEHVESI